MRNTLQISLTNTTKKLCVIGDPVLHSKSPLIHNTILQAMGLDYLYLCQPVPRGQVREWLQCATFTGYAGFNATMPHKEVLVPLMDELDDDAKRFGAVNTVCIRNGRYYGFNTDGRGFVRSLSDAGVFVPGLRVGILGAGGAAKAVSLKLADLGAAQVTVCNRTPEKAMEFCALDTTGCLRPAGFDTAALTAISRECDLWVNCTSLGMEGTGEEFEDFSFLDALPRGGAVCDLIYSPPETRLLAEARLRGLTAMNGLGMLIYQAIFALEHFTETKLDCNAMAKLLETVL